MKKFATIAGSVALLAAAVLPAIAAGNNCSNGTTGPLSTNVCSINNTSTVSVTNNNSATITNNVTARSNSGGNSASMNTLGGAITTGNATLNATIGSVANVNTTTVSGGPAASGNNGSNSVTGPGDGVPATIDNGVWITNTQIVGVTNDNIVRAGNTVNVTANSGDNNANTNTGPASIGTGNTNLRLSLDNHFNDSATGIAAGAGGTGGNGATNNVTGPLSTNGVWITNTQVVGVDNINEAIVNNDVVAVSDSGNNDANTNTGPASIRTGFAGLIMSLLNHLNDNATGVTAGVGGTNGNSGANNTTGPISENFATITNTVRAGVTNDNLLGLDNFIDALSRTGANSASVNTLGGGILTSSAGANVGVGNEGNINTTTIDMAMGGFSSNLSNGVTGPLSLNRVDLLNAMGVSVDNPNVSNVTNYDTDVADAGNNTADTNTGAGSVVAGLSDLVKSILNHLNDSMTVVRQ